jgi:hypothetical protein
MTGQALLLLSDHASYMTGCEYYIDGSVPSVQTRGVYFLLIFGALSAVNLSGEEF